MNKIPETIEHQSSVDFSKCQMEKVRQAHAAGTLEVEAFSPYLADYDLKNGELWPDQLTKTDAIGIEVAQMLKKELPKARQISLYDEYNTDMPDTQNARGMPKSGPQIELSEQIKNNFRKSIENLFQQKGIIEKNKPAEKQYLLVSESSKVESAKKLVKRLEEAGKIIHEGQAIFFHNPKSENSEYQTIPLRTKNGRWLCEALDASSYLDPQNLALTHLVILPEHFRAQQDKVWEILRSLGIQPTHYHNIFYNENFSPKEIVTAIKGAILDPK